MKTQYKIKITGSGTQRQIVQAIHELLVHLQYRDEGDFECELEDHVLMTEITEE